LKDWDAPLTNQGEDEGAFGRNVDGLPPQPQTRLVKGVTTEVSQLSGAFDSAANSKAAEGCRNQKP
jgi:hypothetical protein